MLQKTNWFETLWYEFAANAWYDKLTIIVVGAVSLLSLIAVARASVIIWKERHPKKRKPKI